MKIENKPPLDEVANDDAQDAFLHTMSLGEEFLEHHGVKGQKWGVRKGLNAYAKNKTASLDRTAAGKGSGIDKIRTVGTTSTISLVRNKGIQGSAKVQAGNIHARQNRLAEGSASRVDKLLKYRTSPGAGAYSLGGKNKDTRFTAESDKLKVSKSDHAVTKQVKQDHNNLSDGHFERKYNVSKSNYRKRVAKTGGDPYRASQAAK